MCTIWKSNASDRKPTGGNYDLLLEELKKREANVENADVQGPRWLYRYGRLLTIQREPSFVQLCKQGARRIVVYVWGMT